MMRVHLHGFSSVFCVLSCCSKWLTPSHCECLAFLIHRLWLPTQNHYLLLSHMLLFLSFSFVLTGIVGTLFEPMWCFCMVFASFLPALGGIVVLSLAVHANFGLSFHMHLCFANMAFSLLFVPWQCSVTICSIMSLDVTLIHAFFMNLSRSLCSQSYWPSLSELSKRMISHFSLDGNPPSNTDPSASLISVLVVHMLQSYYYVTSIL